MSDEIHHDIHRRRLMALAAAFGFGTMVPDLASAQGTIKTGKTAQRVANTVSQPPGPGLRFLTTNEFALLDELAEAIIPADGQSGGAKAANVARAIDGHLGESIDPELKQSWREDLAEVDRISLVVTGKSFVRATETERKRVLDRISRNETSPKEASEYAFGTIKFEVAWQYYKSKIGIHDELQYKGNVLLDEFLGVDPSKG